MSSDFVATKLIAFARRRSPFYREWLKGLPEEVTLGTVPIVPLSLARQLAAQQRDPRLTDVPHGLMFGTGGTTSHPRLSPVSTREWLASAREFGDGFLPLVPAKGAIVANLFLAGDLYASFLLCSTALMRGRPRTLHLPIGGALPVERLLERLIRLQPTILLGPPFILYRVLLAWEEARAPLSVRRVFFGGEPFNVAQLQHLQNRLGIDVRSIGYASVDCGNIGAPVPDHTPDVHAPFPSVVFEIVDERGAPIRCTGQAGRVVVTSLLRRLTPVIRHEVGDLAEWIDVQAFPPRFRLLGRSVPVVRLGSLLLSLDDFASALRGTAADGRLDRLQLIVDTDPRGGSQVTIMLGGADADPAGGEDCVEALLAALPALGELVAQGVVARPIVVLCRMRDMVYDSRTGKSSEFVDRRLGQIRGGPS